MLDITFNPAMLVLARESRGFTQQKFVNKLRRAGVVILQAHQAQIELGTMQPSAELIARNRPYR